MTEKEVEDLADEEFGRLAALVAKEAKRREAHSGIKFAKLEAYANFFVYRWSRVRKYGLKDSISCLVARVRGTPKIHAYANSFRKSSTWS